MNRVVQADDTASINKKEAITATSARNLTGPTILTIIRMCLSIIFMIFVLVPETWTRLVALIIFIIASITDLIDGKWARKKKIVTDIGAFLDPLADKMLINLAFLALVHFGVVPLWIFAIILVRDFAVDGMRMMLAREGQTISASIYGKLKTIFQMTALIILLLNLIVNQEVFSILGQITLYFALAMTIFSGLDYIYHGWIKLFDKPNNQKKNRSSKSS